MLHCQILQFGLIFALLIFSVFCRKAEKVLNQGLSGAIGHDYSEVQKFF